MKHIKLYEDFEIPELDPKTKAEYIQELEKHIWNPNLYLTDPDLWSAVVGGPEEDDEDDEDDDEPGLDTSSEEYQELLADYGSIPPEQHRFNHFVRMIAGYGDDPDEDDYYIMEPEEYMETFRGLDPKLIMMIMSLGKQQLYHHVEWEKIK